MKVRRTGRVALLMLLLAAGGCASRPRLSGSWVGREGDRRTELSFGARGLGHRASSGRVQRFRYTVDYARDPVAIDLWLEGERGEAGRVLGIVRFDDDGLVRVKLGRPGGPRPVAFTREAPGLTMRRPPTR